MDRPVLVLVRFDRGQLLDDAIPPGTGPDPDRAADLDDAIAGVLRRLVEEATPRVLLALGLTPDHPSVVHLVDGLAITTTRRWSDSADDLAERVRLAVTGRVRSVAAGVLVDVVAAPRLEVADIVDRPTPGRRTVGSRHGIPTLDVGDAGTDTAVAVRVRTLLRRGGFTLLHEPVVDTATERLVGTRVRVVAEDAVHGRSGSESLRAIARHAAIVRELDEAVVGRACADLRLLTDHLGRRPTTSVPVDPETVADRTYVHAVIDLLRAHRLRPTQLVLVPEPAATGDGADPDDVVDGLRAFRRIGVQLATGHVGTAVGPLGRSLRPGADVLVLDATQAVHLHGHGNTTGDTIDGPPGPPVTAALRRANAASAAVVLARTLGMRVLAEGVEDVNTARRVRAAGCTMSCGRWFGRAVTLDQLFG